MDNKEEPMKPDRYWFNKYLFKCRRCGKVLDILEHIYCPGCGQKIDWSEYPTDEPDDLVLRVKPPTESATDWDGVECE